MKNKGKANHILEEAKKTAEQIKTDKILQAKEKFLELKSKHEIVINQKNQKVLNSENKISEKENKISQKLGDLNRKEKQIEELVNKNNNIKDTLAKRNADSEKLLQKQVEALETISGYSADDARKELVEALKDEAKSRALSHIQEITEEAKLTANKEAKKIIIQTIQRVATEHAIENSVSVFNIESDDVKGRVIGREGRNIRSLEAATGVEIIVDDTPEAIIISSFDPIRREICRLSLQRLVADGRIHPARIEEVVAKTKKQIADDYLYIPL